MNDSPRRTALGVRRAALVLAADARAVGYDVPAPSRRMRRQFQGFCVVNAGADGSATIYAAGAGGNQAPIDTIAGNKTAMLAPAGIARDGTGKIYVANLLGGITVYGNGASGNVAPVATIAGSNTGLDGPGFVALDGAGAVYAINTPYLDQAVLVFAAGATGNVAPIRKITGSATRLDQPNGIAVDDAGSIYVANFGTNGPPIGSIAVFAPGADGNAAPSAVIEGPETRIGAPMGVAVDAAGNIYLRNTDFNSVTVYAPGSNGNVGPIATVSGSATGIIGEGGIAVDAIGTIYVTNAMLGVNTVTVYAPGSNGNVAPIAALNGPATGLDQPFDIALTTPSGCFTLLPWARRPRR